MPTLVHGRYLLTDPAAPDGGLIEDGALCEDEGRIVAVGSHEDLRRRYPLAESMGSDEFLVMPGLINAHHHAWGLSSLQLGTLDVPLELWIGFLWSVRPFDSYGNTLYPALRLIESGVTTVVHSHSVRRATNYLGELDGAVQAYADAGLRVAFAVATRDQNSFVYGDDAVFLSTLPVDIASPLSRMMAGRPGASAESYFEGMDRLIRRWHGAERDRIRVLYAPLNMVWCSDSLLKRIKIKADEYRTSIHTHLSETIYQREYALRRFGKTGAAHLAEIGFLGPNLSAAHGVWLTEDDIRLLAGHGVTICTNAGSNLRLRSGIAPVLALRKAGVSVAIGMDSTTMDDDEDYFSEMRLVWRLHQTPGLDTDALSREDIFQMALRSGARAATWDGQIGSLEVGMRADLILVRLSRLVQPFMAGNVAPVDTLLYQAKSEDVDTVMIDGRVVMKGRRHVRFDRQRIGEQLREQALAPASTEQREISELIDQVKPYLARFYQGWPVDPGDPYYVRNSRGI
jgi:5-methylthioadenosine/S-adenosylhomocysteine deaminase